MSDGQTILIVEDNELNINLFRDLLTAHGYVTLETSGGAEALDLVRQHGPDVVLMYIQLPNVSGWRPSNRSRSSPYTRSRPNGMRKRCAGSGARTV